MMMFEKAENTAQLNEAAQKYAGDIAKFDEDEIRIINAALTILSSLYGDEESKELIEAIKPDSAEGVAGMFSNIVANEKKIRKMEREQGIEQGIAIEKVETAKTLLGMNLTVEQIAKGTRLPIEEVERIKNDLA